MKYKRLCLYGGPGVGKSTLAAKLFVYLKDNRKDLKKVELVQEWIKTWAWEKHSLNQFDSVYVLAKQLRREERLLEKGVTIITDCPVRMSLSYCPYRLRDAFADITREFEKQYKGFHVFLKRDKGYNPEGRWQTEEEAICKDEQIRQDGFSVDMERRYLEISPNSPGAVETIIKRWEECV